MTWALLLHTTISQTQRTQPKDDARGDVDDAESADRLIPPGEE